MVETERLKIKLVEDEEQLNPELWNRAYHQIDRMCTSYEILAPVDYPENTDSYRTFINKKFKIIQIYPANPSNMDEWNRISIANFRCYINESDDQNELIIIPMGSKPKKSVSIGLMGWY